MNSKMNTLGLVLMLGVAGVVFAADAVEAPHACKGTATAPGMVPVKTGITSSATIPDPKDFIPFDVAPAPLPDFYQQPAYPDSARAIGITGRVVVQIFVDKDGLVKRHNIISAQPDNFGFQQEVEKVIYTWKFTPASTEGHPVGAWVQIPVNFNLEPKE